MSKKPNVALGLRFLVAHEEAGEWPSDREGLRAVKAAKAWIKSLPASVTEDDFMRHSNEMMEWRGALRSSLRKCLSSHGASGASIVVGHLTEGQRVACLEEVNRIARSYGMVVRVSARGGDRVTIHTAGPDAPFPKRGSRKPAQARDLRPYRTVEDDDVGLDRRRDQARSG